MGKNQSVDDKAEREGETKAGMIKKEGGMGKNRNADNKDEREEGNKGRDDMKRREG